MLIVVDGHVLHPRVPAALRRPKAPLPFSVREPHRRQSRLWAQDIVHVHPLFLPRLSARSYCLLFSFVGILFLDALQRMYRVTAEMDVARTDHTVHDVRTESNIAARKF